MHRTVRTRRAAVAAAVAGASLLAACGPDPRIEQLTTGIQRDSVLTIIGQDGQAGDPLPNVYSADQYLVGGRSIEVLYFSPDGLKAGTDSVNAREALTPIVLMDQQLAGHGWTFLDSVATANRIGDEARTVR